MEELKPVILLEDLKFHEKIISGFVKFIGYGLGGIPHIPHFFRHGTNPSQRGFKIQSSKYTENGEIIYTSYTKPAESFGFVELGTFNKLLERSAKLYSTQPCLGRRSLVRKITEHCPILKKEIVRYEFGPYKWKTYQIVYLEVSNIAKRLVDIGIDENNKFCLFGNTSPEWLMMAYALSFVSSPVVTVYPTLSDESIMKALNQTEIFAIMVDEKTLPRILTMLNQLKSLKYIIVSTYVERVSELPSETDSEVRYFRFEDFSSYESQTDPLSKQPKDPDSLALIMYTSGSTGMPKGVMISHKNLLTCFDAVSQIRILLRSSNKNKPHVYAAFLPSSHVFECVFEIAFVGLGHMLGFSTPQTLFDMSPMIIRGTKGDLNVLRPSVMITVPLLLERLKKQVLDKIKQETRLKQLIFQCSYKMKMDYRKIGFKTPLMDKIVFKNLRKLFGGKLQISFIGGAYISRNTEEFANIGFGTFRQGYGLTESTDGIILTDVEYMRTGSCGSPLSHCEVKLVPWPEGNRFPDDKKSPSGEIAISGDSIALGYYKNQALTDECFVTDPITKKRWFYTGDIAVVLPDLTLKIIDRKKDIVKLAHGEYTSLAKIESVIGECPIVELLCVLPNSTSEYLVALICPHREKTKEYLESQSLFSADDSIEQKLSVSEIREMLSKYVESCVIKNLSKNDTPKKFIIITDTWTPEKDLITPTVKIKRHRIAKEYNHLLV